MSKPLGGPKREAIFVDKVIPMNFNSDDPFYDLAFVQNALEERIRTGKTTDLLLIEKLDEGYRFSWRGNARLSEILGVMDLVRFDLMADRSVDG